MADNKIQISVEVLNNTKTSINQIMTDLTNMNASIQAATATTNQLITQSMQKSAATIQAANQTAAAAASGSYQTMQLNAKTASDNIKTSFVDGSKKVKDSMNDIKNAIDKIGTSKGIEEQSRNTTKALEEIKNKIKEGSISNKEAIDSELEAWKAYRDSLKKAADTIKEVSKAEEDNVRVLKKEEDAHNSSTKAKEQHTESTKKQNGALEQLTKRFISIAAAIYLVRKAYMEATASVKAYEEAAISQGKLSKGAAAGPKIEQAMKQFEVEAGSVIEPTLQEIASWLKANNEEIGGMVRKTVAIVIDGYKVIGGALNVTTKTIEAAFDSLISIISEAFNLLVQGINNVVQELPLIPQGFKDSIKGFAADVELANKTWIEVVKKDGANLQKAVGDLAKNSAKLFEDFFIGPAESGVKALTQAQKDAAQKLRDLYKTEMEWLLSLKQKASETSVNEDYAAQEKINNEYLKNKERIYNDEKIFHKDLTEFKIANEYIYQTETNKLAQERHDRDMKIIQDSHNARIAEIDAARKAASSAGILGTIIQPTTPGTSMSLTGNEAARKTSAKGQLDLSKNLDSYEELYTNLKNTVGVNESQLSEMRINIEQYTANAIMQIEYDMTQAKVDSISQTVNAYAEAGNMIAEIANNVYQVQLNNINRETEERQKALDKAYAGASKYVKNKGKLDQQQKEANEKLQEEQAAKTREIQEKQKNAAIAQALIAGATATMNAWSASMQLGMPAGLIMGIAMSALITALTVAQVAVIESQKFAQGGIVQGPATGDQVPIQANGGEMVLTTSQQASLWNMIATRSGSTNTASASINMGGDTYIVSGSLDKTAVSEIRRMKEERQAQLRADIKELSYRNQLQLAR